MVMLAIYSPANVVRTTDTSDDDTNPLGTIVSLIDFIAIRKMILMNKCWYSVFMKLNIRLSG